MLSSILADSSMTISIGNQSVSFGLNIVLYLIVAAVVGLIAEMIVGWRVPFGIIGAIIAGLIGIWLMTRVIIITGVGDIVIWDVQLIRAIIGSVILIALWHLITGGFRTRRS